MARKHNVIDKIDNFIGSKVYMLRLARGMSRQQLSDSLGVTHQQLQKYEKGLNRISVGRLALISKALEKPVDYFYAGFDESAKKEELITQHQRMCIEVSRNFMKLNNPEHQSAVNILIKSLIRESA